MINSEHSISHIKQECIRIMLLFPDMFPVVETIIDYINFNKYEKHNFIINYTIFQYMGLDYIIASKTNAMAEIWWTLHHSQFKVIEKAIIESVLLCYTKPYIFEEDKERWDQLLKEIEK